MSDMFVCSVQVCLQSYPYNWSDTLLWLNFGHLDAISLGNLTLPRPTPPRPTLILILLGSHSMLRVYSLREFKTFALLCVPCLSTTTRLCIQGPSDRCEVLQSDALPTEL